MNNKGYSLVELLVALGIFSVLIVVLNQLFFFTYKGQQRIINQQELQQNLHIAIEEIMDGVQHSGGVYGEQLNDHSTLQLYTYVPKGTTGQYHWQKIEYYLESDLMAMDHIYQLKGKTLYRKINGGQAQPIANFIKKMKLNYYDAKGNPTNQWQQVRSIEVELIGEYGGKEYSVKDCSRLLIPRALEGKGGG